MVSYQSRRHCSQELLKIVSLCVSVSPKFGREPLPAGPGVPNWSPTSPPESEPSHPIERLPVKYFALPFIFAELPSQEHSSLSEESLFNP
jgi:hypothetical protein